MIELSGTLTSEGLSRGAKRKIADAMFEKGVSFTGAAILLRRQGGYEHVVLHLICQGVENVMKSILLQENFDKYKKKIKKKIGHNLVLAVDEVIKEKGARNIAPELRDELIKINHFYKNHFLRYGGMSDIFVQCQKSDSDLVLYKLMQIINIIRYRQAKGK